MSSNRLRLDLALVLTLAVAGVLLFPWGQRRYYVWLLHSPNPEQAMDAAEALVALGPSALPDVVHVVRTGGAPSARLRAFDALLEFEDARVLPVVLDVAAADWDQELQSIALQIMAGRPEARAIFETLVNDPDSQIRYGAVRGLIATRDPAIVPILVRSIDDSEPMVAAIAALTLSKNAGLSVTFPMADTPEAEAARADARQQLKAWYAQKFNPADILATPPRPLVTSTGPANPPVRPVAPAFALQALDGSTVRLADFRGKPVLINFWASWCIPCINEMQDLVDTAEAFGDAAVVLGVAAEYRNEFPAQRDLEARGQDATPEAIQQVQTEAVHRFVVEHQVDYPVVFGDVQTLDAYNAYALPTTVIVGPDGRIFRRVIGERSREYFLATLRAAADGAA